MASLIPGFEYDIFISYRQKDNRHDGWVTNFAEALRSELGSTFKEEVSLFFDVNRSDDLTGKKESDEALRKKLKSLIFIPILSHTYCDTASFGWEKEFKPFIELASADQMGLKVKLPGGNIYYRVLPVKIYELSKADMKLCESLLDASVRSIEFIFKSSGVNRPLLKDDNPAFNLYHTNYRDQINKVANTIHELIMGLRNESLVYETIEIRDPVLPHNKRYIPEKSIIVLPFENISPEPDQDYFTDGLTEEIITDLSNINDLLVISRSSAMTFKGAKKRLKEIASEVRVRYVLEGSVRKAGNDLRITAQLIDAKSDTHLWAEKYNGILDDIFDIQEKVSRSIVSALCLKLTVNQERKISRHPIDNFQVYDLYLKARNSYFLFTREGLNEARQLLEKGEKITGDNALLYATLAWIYEEYVRLGFSLEDYLEKAEDYARRALRIDQETTLAHIALGMVYYLQGDLKKCVHEGQKALKIDPNNIETIQWVPWSYIMIGKTAEALNIATRILVYDPLNPISYMVGVVYFYMGQFDKAVEVFRGFVQKMPWTRWWLAYYLVYTGKNEEALRIIETLEVASHYSYFCASFLKYILRDEQNKIPGLLTDEFIGIMNRDAMISLWVATFYAMMDDYTRSVEWLRNAVKRGFINYPYIFQYDPFLSRLKNEPGYRELKKHVKEEWESFRMEEGKPV